MNIAIIGAGNVGTALATSAVRAGHRVQISSTDQAHAEAAAATTGATAAASNTDAVKNAEIVILAVPFATVDALAAELGTAVDGKIVVDVTNRPTPDPASPGTSISAAEIVQAAFPKARVVKAFNTAFASRHADPTVGGQQVDGYVAGDDATARARVLELVESIGFRPIDAGGLIVARTLEGMAWLNISLQIRNGWPWQAGWKLVGPTEQAA